MTEDRKFELVIILWEDAHEDSDWIEYNDIQRLVGTPTICRRVGWLLFDDDDAVIVASERDENNKFCDIVRIPRGMIRGRKLLKAEAIWLPGQDKLKLEN